MDTVQMFSVIQPNLNEILTSTRIRLVSGWFLGERLLSFWPLCERTPHYPFCYDNSFDIIWYMINEYYIYIYVVAALFNNKDSF